MASTSVNMARLMSMTLEPLSRLTCNPSTRWPLTNDSARIREWS